MYRGLACRGGRTLLRRAFPGLQKAVCRSAGERADTRRLERRRSALRGGDPGRIHGIRQRADHGADEVIPCTEKRGIPQCARVPRIFYSRQSAQTAAMCNSASTGRVSMNFAWRVLWRTKSMQSSITGAPPTVGFGSALVRDRTPQGKDAPEPVPDKGDAAERIGVWGKQVHRYFSASVCAIVSHRSL